MILSQRKLNIKRKSITRVKRSSPNWKRISKKSFPISWLCKMKICWTLFIRDPGSSVRSFRMKSLMNLNPLNRYWCLGSYQMTYWEKLRMVLEPMANKLAQGLSKIIFWMILLRLMDKGLELTDLKLVDQMVVFSTHHDLDPNQFITALKSTHL